MGIMKGLLLGVDTWLLGLLPRIPNMLALTIGLVTNLHVKNTLSLTSGWQHYKKCLYIQQAGRLLTNGTLSIQLHLSML